MSAKPQDALPSGRLMSIDALRGFDMFWIIGGRELLLAVFGLFYATRPEWLSYHTSHPDWIGFSAWDMIMPLFLFIVGTAMPFSFAKRIEEGQPAWAIYRKILLRVVILWVLGMVVQGNLLKYDLAQLRLFSNTLQAIAVGYLIAALAMLHLRIVGQVLVTAGLLLAYWLVLAFIPMPGQAPGLLESKANLALYIDDQILGRFRDGTTYTWILSGLAFGATVLLGVLGGHLLRSARNPWLKVLFLLMAGGGCLGLGWAWGHWFPIIKHLFTSSMVLWAAGWSYLLLALFYLVIDVLGLRRWAFFFTVIGMNAILAYVVSHVWSFRQLSAAVVGNLAKRIAEQGSVYAPWAELLSAVSAVALLWLILWQLYRTRTFLRV